MFADRVKDSTTTTGTGNVTLSGAAPTGFQTFASRFAVGVRFYYAIAAGAEWETGIGYLSASDTLVRERVLQSSNSDALVNFSSGTKDVFNTIAADKANDDASIGLAIALSSANYLR